MTRLRGRALCGKRVHAKSPHGHWQTTMMLCAMRLDGSTACMAVEGATDTEVFRAYVERVLCPTVQTGDLVVMDNLSPHKSEATLSLFQQAGAQVLSLRPTPRTSIPSRTCGAKSGTPAAQSKRARSRI